MLKAIVTDMGARMEVEVGSEDIHNGDIKVEKIFYMQGSPLALFSFSDKGTPVTNMARFDMQKGIFIDASPLTIQEGDDADTKIHRLSQKINRAWDNASRQATPQAPEVEFVTPAGQPFTNFGTPQP